MVQEGGSVEGGRLSGYLSVSRAFGDAEPETLRKPAGLSAEPELRSEPLQPDDEFVILGSDGLWGVLPAAEAVCVTRAQLRAYDEAQIAAEKLVELAASRGPDDNITAMVVRLWPEKAKLPSCAKLASTPSFVRMVGGF